MCVETVPHFNLLLFLQLVTCPNASFTDLAEIVSRIEPVKPALVDGKSMLNLINVPFKCTFWQLFSRIFGVNSQHIDLFLASA